MTNSLPTGSTIGILGGGQLGRMLCVAASRLGYHTHIYEPAAEICAAEVARQVTNDEYSNLAALQQFAQSIDVLTYEFENIPTEALAVLEKETLLRPNQEALRVSQDRLTEKEFLKSIGLKPAPFAAVDTLSDLEKAIGQIGPKGILKTRRFGYDGKGQIRLDQESDLDKAHNALANAPAVLEGFVDFTCEISVIVARSASGSVTCFDPAQNVHKEGILRSSTVPAPVPQSVLMDAVLAAGKIVQTLEYIGVMGVEFFVTPSGLIVNEIAPRVHNSGHWTQNGCAVDQFEQHIRAVVGLPLGDGQRHSDVVMENLIGDDLSRMPQLYQEPNAAVHLYGKSTSRAGRKMGHVNFVTPKK